MSFSPQRRAIFRHQNFKKCSEPVSFFTFSLANVLLAHLNFKKWSKHAVFCAFWLANVPRYSGVQFYHIWTSKSGPNLLCFVHFDLKMCFSLQRRAILPHLNFKKWSEPAVVCTFWLENVLLATAACNFTTSELQKVVRTCCVLYILTWTCASRYSGVQFSISPLNSYLRTRRFSELTFRPSRPTNHWKNTAFRDFPNISRVWIFFLLTFARLYLLSSDSTSLVCFFIFWLCYSALLFQLSILSEVRLLNFLW